MSEESLEKSISKILKLHTENINQQIKNLAGNYEKDIKHLTDAIEENTNNFKELRRDLSEKYVTKELLTNTIAVLAAKISEGDRGVTARFDWIRSLLIWGGSIIGGVVLVGLASYLFNNAQF